MPRPQAESLIRVLTRGEKATLARAEFRGSYLSNIDLSGADLRGAVFEDVTLRGVDFSRADLRGATFRACDLRQARFDGSRWGGNLFSGSLFTHSSALPVDQVTEILSAGGRFMA